MIARINRWMKFHLLAGGQKNSVWGFPYLSAGDKISPAGHLRVRQAAQLGKSVWRLQPWEI